MGRRSTATTKSGKYMNPADQARKQQRKKELKKNKKTRQAVREATLRNKDPKEMLKELEQIDKLESKAGTGDVPHENALRERRRRVTESLSRVLRYLEKNDQSAYVEMKKLWDQVEKRRQLYLAEHGNPYESKELDEFISLPDIPLPSDIPLPPQEREAHRQKSKSTLSPPPPPPGPPPPGARRIPHVILLSLRTEAAASVTTAAAESMEGVDNGSSDSEAESVQGESDEESSKSESVSNKLMKTGGITAVSFPPPPPPPPPPGALSEPVILPLMPPPPPPPPQMAMPRFPYFPDGPHPLPPHALHVPLAPPPPSHMQHHQLQQQRSEPLVYDFHSMRMPRLAPPPPLPGSGLAARTPSSGRNSPPPPPSKQQQQQATISAAPQLRDTQAEVTKFTPTSLRIRREQPRPTSKPKVRPSTSDGGSRAAATTATTTSGRANPTAKKDAAYAQFMKEMEGLL